MGDKQTSNEPRQSNSISSVNLLVPPSILFILVILLFGLRLHSRFTTSRLALDDLLLATAVSAGLGLYILCTLSVINGLGHHINTLSPRHISTLARLQLFIAEFYVWTSTFLKLCLAWMIFRIQGNIAIWRRGLIAMMAFVATLAVACCLWDYLQCRPINALWDLSYSRDHCSLAAYHKWIYTASSMFLLTDAIFATLPIFFISKIRRPTREKIVLCCLMALGLICTAAVVPKLIALSDYASMSDFTYASAGMMLWSQIEVSIGIIGACIPVLKPLFERALRRVGLMSSSGTSRVTSHGAAGYIQPPQLDKGEHVPFPKPVATTHTFSKPSSKGNSWRMPKQSWIDLEEQTMLKERDDVQTDVAMQSRAL